MEREKKKVNVHPSKHARSDPEAFWLRSVTAVTASVQPVSGRILYMLDPTSRIRFSSVFPKKAWIIFCKTGPGPIWMALSGLGRMHPVWKQACVKESSGPVSGRTQPARYRFPTFRLGCVLPQTARIILGKTSPGPIGLWPTVSRFWPNGSNPKASRSRRIIGPASLPSRQKLWTLSCDFVPDS